MNFQLKLIVLVFSLGLPSISLTQQINVASGAHDGFARLVFRVPDNSDWDLQNDETRAIIKLTNFEQGFNIDSVFALIDRSYISEINNTTASLEIIFSCDCTANAYQLANGYLVVDVSRTRIQDLNTTDILYFTNEPGIEPLDLRFGSIYSESTERDVVATLTEGELQVSKNEKENSEVDITSGIVTRNRTKDRVEFKKNNILNQAQKKLARHISEAATLGILDPAQSTFNLPQKENKSTIDDQIFNSSTLLNENHIQPPSSGNLRVTNSSDLPNTPDQTSIELNTLGVPCIPPNMTDVTLWGDNATNSQKFGEYRSSLYTSIDRVDVLVALKLAQLFLYHGFGAEAIQVLSIDPQLFKENPHLVEIGEIMEYGFVRNPKYLINFIECDSSVALWALLSQKNVPSFSDLNSRAALRGTSALPIHLRRFIAPELSRRFLKYGDEDNAEAALRTLDRSTAAPTGTGRLARADLQMSSGKTELAQGTLADIVSSNEQHSAEALIKFVESHLEADTQIDESVATLVEAYAVEMRDDTLGSELRRSHVLALAKSGQFDAAYAALNQTWYENDDSKKSDLRAELLSIATRTASDATFVENFFSDATQNGLIVDVKVIKQALGRLIDLGFTTEADTFLANTESMPNTSAFRVLRAEIALRLGRAAEAEGFLFGVKSKEADVLRAKAKLKAGDFIGAQRIYMNLGDDEASQTSALMAEDWDFLVQQNSDVFGSLADLSTRTLDTNRDPNEILERAALSISESERARAIVSSLLQQQP